MIANALSVHGAPAVSSGHQGVPDACLAKEIFGHRRLVTPARCAPHHSTHEMIFANGADVEVPKQRATSSQNDHYADLYAGGPWDTFRRFKSERW